MSARPRSVGSSSNGGYLQRRYEEPTRHGSPSRFRISQRDLIILIVALVAGFGTELLLSSAGVPLGQAVIGGVTAFGSVLLFVVRILN